MAEKIYLNGSGKEVKFSNGGSIINCYIDLDDAKEKGLIRKTKAGKNIVVFSLAERREESEYGDTHYLFHKPYEPKESERTKKVAKTKESSSKKAEDDGMDDLPF